MIHYHHNYLYLSLSFCFILFFNLAAIFLLLFAKVGINANAAKLIRYCQFSIDLRRMATKSEILFFCVG